MRDATWWPMETQRGHDLLLRAFLRVTVQEGAAVLARADRESALEILVARAEGDPPVAGAPHAREVREPGARGPPSGIALEWTPGACSGSGTTKGQPRSWKTRVKSPKPPRN